MQDKITLNKEPDGFNLRCEHGTFGRFIDKLTIEDIKEINELCVDRIIESINDENSK